MSENGPLMYRVKPLYDSRPDIVLPTCMYKMNSLYASEKVTCISSSNKECVGQDNLELIEMEKRQADIIQKLKHLKEQVLKMKQDFGIKMETTSHIFELQDIVIKANPCNPPLSVWIFHQLISKSTTTRLATHVHSSLKILPEKISKLPNYLPDEKCNISLTVIWRDGPNDHEMMVNPIHQGPVEGEVNIARYIARLTSFNYDIDPVLSTQMDDWLEVANSSIIHGNNKDRQGVLRSLNSHLGKNLYLVGNSLSLADIVMWSVLIQAQLHSNLPTNVSKWFKLLLSNELFIQCSEFTSL